MSKTEVNRTKPNILITGTPGTGKTTISDLIASASGLKHFDVGQVVRRSDLHSGYDEEYDAYYIDEDKASTKSLEYVLLDAFFNAVLFL